MMDSLRVYPPLSQNNDRNKESSKNVTYDEHIPGNDADIAFYRKEIEKLMFAISTKESKVSNVIRDGESGLTQKIHLETSNNKKDCIELSNKQIILESTRKKPVVFGSQENKKDSEKKSNIKRISCISMSRPIAKDYRDVQENDVMLFCYKSELV